MSVCPGCGRCRECGHRAASPYPYPYTTPARPWLQPWEWRPPYYVGDPIPGAPGTTTITCQNTGGDII